MKIQHIDEPRLIFSRGEHICPKRGIAEYGVFDLGQQSRRKEIHIGGVGTSACIELLDAWLQRCRSSIAAPSDIKQENLRLPFCGFNLNSGFGAEFKFPDDFSRALRNSEISEIVKINNRNDRVQKSLDLYYENVKFLAQNRQVDVIVCVIPDELYDVISLDEFSGEESLEVKEEKEEFNFRRALKARAMHLAKPIQLIRQSSINPSKTAGQQDDATKAWNFCTALYYKSGPVIPWKLKQESSKVSSCAVGISFYRSRDHQILSTSLAQIFDELGNGLILRGTPVEIDKDDRIPRLSSEQAYDLISAALNEYRIAMKNFPSRLVIHKSANFTHEEIEGIEQAAREEKIDAVDFVTVMDSKIRLFRDGDYPPFRGTLAHVDETKQLLYSRGSVWYYQTYTGLYVPRPIELRIVKSEESPAYIAKEILGLTKLNWNNTQFDGKYPVTLGCSRKVGEVMKYLGDNEAPQIRYAFYM